MENATPDAYRELFEHSADAQLIIDGDRFVDCNQAALDMLRYSDRHDLLQTHPSQLSPDLQPDGRLSFDKANEMIAVALEQGSHRFEWTHRRADGSSFPVEVLLTAVPSPTGTRLHTVWRDMSRRKQLEAELRHAQKMEAVGKLAGGVAHDFNNLLVTILGHSEMLEESLTADAELRQSATEIREAGERAAELVDQLLSFSRKKVLEPRVVDVVPLLQGLSRMLQRLLEDHIDFAVDLPAAALCVHADPGQLEQAVVNLVTNARDAVGRGGRIALAARLHSLDGNHADSGGLPPGDYALISVQDDGAGMPPEVLERVFDPFFTTKGPGKGTGLGLAMVYGVIKQSGGDIVVESHEGRGTRFDIYLPATDDRPAALAKERPVATAAIAERHATILLAEDDDAAAQLMARVLLKAGYDVHRVGDGIEALTMVDGGELVEPDLLLSDVVMPRMGGLELARLLRERFTALPVLLATGYAEDPDVRDCLGIDYDDIIQKPFSPQELLQRVKQVLRARGDRISP